MSIKIKALVFTATLLIVDIITGYALYFSMPSKGREDIGMPFILIGIVLVIVGGMVTNHAERIEQKIFELEKLKFNKK